MQTRCLEIQHKQKLVKFATWKVRTQVWNSMKLAAIFASSGVCGITRQSANNLTNWSNLFSNYQRFGCCMAIESPCSEMCFERTQPWLLVNLAIRVYVKSSWPLLNDYGCSVINWAANVLQFETQSEIDKFLNWKFLSISIELWNSGSWNRNC